MSHPPTRNEPDSPGSDPGTLEFYERNSEHYAQRTLDADVSTQRDAFAARLPTGAAVLDAGCGAGRDALAFRRIGFDVTAVDASPSMCAIARRVSGARVYVMDLFDLPWEGTFDAVWACASLLHTPEPDLPKLFRRLLSTLRSGGILQASFKHGKGWRRDDFGRTFTDLDRERVRRILDDVPEGRLLDAWTTRDGLNGWSRNDWFNLLLLECFQRKQSPSSRKEEDSVPTKLNEGSAS